MDFGRIGHLMEKVAAHGGIMVVHAEDDDLVQFNYELFTEEGRTAGTNLHLVHSKLSEHLSFARTLLLAEAKGAAVYFVHTSAREGVAAIEHMQHFVPPTLACPFQELLVLIAAPTRPPATGPPPAHGGQQSWAVAQAQTHE